MDADRPSPPDGRPRRPLVGWTEAALVGLLAGVLIRAVAFPSVTGGPATLLFAVGGGAAGTIVLWLRRR